MANLNYTSVQRIFDQEPLLDDATIISSSQLCKFAEDAEAEVNGMLAARFTIPISGSPPLLQTVATKLTIGLVLSQRIFTQERLQESDWPKAFIDSARDTLDRLLEGKMTLVSSAGTVVAARNDLSEIWSNTKDFAPTHTELEPTRHVIDPDKIQELEDARNLDSLADRILK